jgi:hypothetical protein
MMNNRGERKTSINDSLCPQGENDCRTLGSKEADRIFSGRMHCNTQENHRDGRPATFGRYDPSAEDYLRLQAPGAPVFRATVPQRRHGGGGVVRPGARCRG